MALQVEVLSKENIKPSSPTPQDLKKYTLSFVDQIIPQYFMPLIYFYSATEQTQINYKSDHLKKSLSEALSRFHPLAGRRTNNYYVDCNDEGGLYMEACVNSNLSDVIHDPVPNELNKLLPFELDHVTDINFAVQVNFFKCGGIAIGVMLSHKVADASSFPNFMNVWSAIASENQNIPSPVFKSAELFPPLDMLKFMDLPTGIVKEYNLVCKRFVFSSSKISELREKCAEGYKNHMDTTNSKRPTRFEALSAFIWYRFIATIQKLGGDKIKMGVITYLVNLRTRFNPPLPENQFGNLFSVVQSVPLMGNEGKANYWEIIKKGREAISSINVDELRKGENHLMHMTNTAQNHMEGVVNVTFTSLSRLSLYDTNFGWGEPVWIGSVKQVYERAVTFIDTKDGDGIEAWINLKEDEMAMFEGDKEFMSFVSPTVV